MSSTATISTTSTIIRLVGSNVSQVPRVTWDPSTIDNEHMNKKSSKMCCIFHRKRSWDSSDSDSDSDSGNAYEPKPKPRTF